MIIFLRILSFRLPNTGHALHLPIFIFQMLEVVIIYQVQLEMFVLIGLIPHYSKQIELFLTHLPHLIKQNLKYSTSVKAMMDFIDVGLISKCHKLVLRGSISRLQVSNIFNFLFYITYDTSYLYLTNHIVLKQYAKVHKMKLINDILRSEKTTKNWHKLASTLQKCST